MLLNCGVGEDSWGSLGLQGDLSSPITSWQIDGKTMETMRDFILGGSKITADGDCSHEIKRRLLFGRKALTKLDSILKSKDIALTTKVHLVKAMVFPVIIYGCEKWTIKKAECRRIDAFEVWCWTRLLRVPWTPRRSNQSILKEISLEYSLEGLMLKVKLQYFGYLIWKDPDAGKDWRREEKETTEDEMVGWHHRLNGHEFEQSPGIGEGQGSLVCSCPWEFPGKRTGVGCHRLLRQASLSITNSRSSLKLKSMESVMPSSHLILCRPFLLLPPIPPSIRVFSNESTSLQLK